MNKVPCGGFTAGAGLKVDDGTVSVYGGVETWIWCEMSPQTSISSEKVGAYYVTKVHITDADLEELWSFTPTTPSTTSGLFEALNWCGEHERVQNLGFGRINYSSSTYWIKPTISYYPWTLSMFSFGITNKDENRIGYTFIDPYFTDIMDTSVSPYKQYGYASHIVSLLFAQKPGEVYKAMSGQITNKNFAYYVAPSTT